LEAQLCGVKMEKFEKMLSFVNSEKFGLELDCDAIIGFPSSASSPAGFTLNEVQQMLIKAGKEQNCVYFHICEAVANEDFHTGKALSYLITSFLKSRING
ncbi:MAG TPA: hypothetical protein VFM59_05970, partial [Salinimicrobium sp.]|nr:hypothetical protein [Salinimicrobium sp.]